MSKFVLDRSQSGLAARAGSMCAVPGNSDGTFHSKCNKTESYAVVLVVYLFGLGQVCFHLLHKPAV